VAAAVPDVGIKVRPADTKGDAMTKEKQPRTNAELIKELREARHSEAEYKEMLHATREENSQLKQYLAQANERGEIVRNFLSALKYQTSTMNRVFGVAEEKN
jgi:hypothetical protein